MIHLLEKSTKEAQNMSNDFFGGIFDFNRDGKTDFSEQFLGFMIMQDIMKTEDDDNDLDVFDDSDQE
jgi:hypothetical protein